MGFSNSKIIAVCAIVAVVSIGYSIWDDLKERRKAEKELEAESEETWVDDPVEEVNPPSEKPSYYDIKEGATNDADIYKITAEEFLADNGNEKLTATYFILSDRLTGFDEDTNEINPKEVGNTHKSLKGYFKNTSESLFMRNESEGIDFEIVGVNELFEAEESTLISSGAGYI